MYITILVKQFCWYISQVSGERLQDHWSSGFDFVIVGFLHLNLTDPSYPNSTIYQFGVGVTCEGAGFYLNFSIPTGDSARTSKMFQIQVKDSHSTYQLMIYAPAQEVLTFKKGG